MTTHTDHGVDASLGRRQTLYIYTQPNEELANVLRGKNVRRVTPSFYSDGGENVFICAHARCVNMCAGGSSIKGII